VTRLLHYDSSLTQLARRLRSALTDSERHLWGRLRRKQLHGVQFYRQKPIGAYIVDFYAPQAKLIVEIDGSQHCEGRQATRDARRDEYLTGIGLLVMRFNSSEVLTNTDAVVEAIYQVIVQKVPEEIPPRPPLRTGGSACDPTGDSERSGGNGYARGYE